MIDLGAEAIPPGSADWIHVHPDAATSAADLETWGQDCPVFLHLGDPARVGAPLAPLASSVIVPSRRALVHLVDQVELGPRVARIQHPSSELPLRERRPVEPRPGQPLRLLHLGSGAAESGLRDLTDALRELPPLSVQLTVIGPVPDEEQRRLVHRAGPAVLRFRAWPSSSQGWESIEADLAVFPSRVPQSYALGVDDALALGLPVWISGGEVVYERYDASACTLLTSSDPDAWRETLEAWLSDPRLAAVEREALPMPNGSAARTAEVLVRWFRESTPAPRETDIEHRRPA